MGHCCFLHCIARCAVGSAMLGLPTGLRDGCAATLNTADELVFIFYRASVPASVVDSVKVLRSRQERPPSNFAWVVTRRPSSMLCRAAPARFVITADGAGHVGVSDLWFCGRNGRCGSSPRCELGRVARVCPEWACMSVRASCPKWPVGRCLWTLCPIM